jgi:hypothetical protein
MVLYEWQVAQLLDVQPPHELPVPAIGAIDPPLLSFEKHANCESIRFADFPHEGQSASAFALLNERSRSNLVLHMAHLYSYIGILFSPFLL